MSYSLQYSQTFPFSRIMSLHLSPVQISRPTLPVWILTSGLSSYLRLHIQYSLLMQVYYKHYV